MCRFICDNTSSFEVEILKIQVRDSASNQMYLNLTMPKLRVPPNQTWESEPWMVEGKDRPSFIKTLVLNVIPGLSTEMNYKLTKETTDNIVKNKLIKKNINQTNRILVTIFKFLLISINCFKDSSLNLVSISIIFPPYFASDKLVINNSFFWGFLLNEK